jgi:hypothetical protein
VIAVIIFALATPALAQEERKIQVNIGGGFTATEGQVNAHFGNGGNFAIGGIFNLTAHVGIQAEYAYNPLGTKLVASIPPFDTIGSDTQLFAGHHMHQGTFNVIGKFGGPGALVRPYGIAGFGVYHRVVQLTSPGTGVISACDPWWYICDPSLAPVTNILGERTTTDPGMDFGGGVALNLGKGVQFYTEIRFNYIWGPKLSSFVTNGTLPPGVPDENANGKYLPITFGLRF